MRTLANLETFFLYLQEDDKHVTLAPESAVRGAVDDDH